MKRSIVLKNDIAEIQDVKAAMVEYGKAHQIPDEILHDLNLVLEEAVSNVIFYGYDEAEAGAHQIEVQIFLQEQTLLVEIIDDARPFNPLDRPEPDLDVPFEEREIGGMGIYLVRTLMDDVTYRRAEGKNVLSMRKKLP